MTLLLALSVPFFAQENLIREFQSLTERELNDKMPGILVHVECPDRNISWSGAAGFSDKEAKIPMQPDQSFRIASVTKTFVASTIIKLWEDGKISLNDPITKYISKEHAEILESGGYPVNEITIRHLLSHSSGLFDHAQSENYFTAIQNDPAHKWTRTEQIQKAVEWGKPLGKTGERFSYSDTGYILLGEIIEKITGKSMNDAIRKELNFRKLGLNNTWIEGFRPQARENRIHQYFGDADTYNYSPSIDLYGGGGFLSTTADLAKYFQLLFNHKVFKYESSLDTMLAPVSYTEKPRMDYRKGMYLIKISGMDVYTHTGFWGTQVVYIPQLNTSISANYSQVWDKRGPAPVIPEIIKVLQEYK